MFYVYILYSKSKDVFYKGFTTDVEKRLYSHISGKSKFTSVVNDWELKYSRRFETKTEALIEEKRLKKLNRMSIEKLLHGYNPEN